MVSVENLARIRVHDRSKPVGYFEGIDIGVEVWDGEQAERSIHTSN